MTHPAPAAHGHKRADRRRLLAIGAAGLLGLLLVVYLRSKAAPAAGASGSGEYYDSAGNLYDANGNLIQAAPNSSSSDLGGGDLGGGGGTSLSGGTVPDTTDLGGTSDFTSAGAGDLSGLVSALEAISASAPDVAGADTPPPPPNVYVTVTPTPQPPATTGGGGGAGAGAASNVASVVKLANGATLTTLTTGKQIEQAAGKTPYVVKSAPGEAAPAPHVAAPAAAHATAAHAAATVAASAPAITSAPSPAELATRTQKLITEGAAMDKVLVHGAVAQ